MKKIALFLSILCMLPAAQAQLEVVHHFGKTMKGLYIVGDTVTVQASDEILQSTSLASWTPYRTTNFDWVSTDNALYFIYDQLLFQFRPGGNHRQVGPIDTVGTLTGSGPHVISVHRTENLYHVRKYNTTTGAVVKYPSLYMTSFFGDLSLAANDSILLLGFGTLSGYFGARMLHLNQGTWDTLHLPNIMANTVFMKENHLWVIEGKGCQNLYYTSDYGRTSSIKAVPNAFSGTCYGSIPVTDSEDQLRSVENNLFYVTNASNSTLTSEVFVSADSGVSWTSILKDSMIVGAEARGEALFLLTQKGTLLKYSTGVISALATEAWPAKALTVSDGSIRNLSTRIVELQIFDILGQHKGHITLTPQSSTALSLSTGMYLLHDATAQQCYKLLINK
ncbi:MAG TPA: hypothetical protein VL947_09715 [Cytophagales bacterium]|nr:hypothetical protein [Cytophagales bacterium]